VIVDTLGLIIALVVHPANIQDRDGGKLLIRQLGTRFRRLQLIFADGGYAGKFVHWVRGGFGRFVEIVERPAVGQFVVLPKRWIVERTFAWLGKYRRLSKDYETLTECSECVILLAMINLMAHRLSPG
jgi:putative transposase